MSDPYEVLGVARDATDKEIADAYRKLAIKHHPDKNPGNTEAADQFKKIAAAFEVIGDKDKRAQYDRYGHAGSQANFGGFGDIFESIFRRQPATPRARNREVSVNIDFLEAATGCVREVSISRSPVCGACKGSGYTSWDRCSRCAGSGRMLMDQPPFRMEVKCSSCQGRGQVPATPCDSCKSTGKLETKEEILVVDIPAGIVQGMHVVIGGKGDMAPSGAMNGDLYVKVNIRSHEFFVRQYDQDPFNIYLNLPLTYSQLMIGTELEIPTISGTAKLKVPPLTTPGKKMRLKGLGVPNVNNPGRLGDMYVILSLDMPNELSDEYINSINGLFSFEQSHASDLCKKFQNFK
jgi:molecular chaperone DnaJ